MALSPPPDYPSRPTADPRPGQESHDPMTPEADKRRLKAGGHAVCYTCRLHDHYLSGDGPLRQEIGEGLTGK